MYIFRESAGYVVGIPITSHSSVDLFLQDRDCLYPILIFAHRLLPANYWVLLISLPPDLILSGDGTFCIHLVRDTEVGRRDSQTLDKSEGYSCIYRTVLVLRITLPLQYMCGSFACLTLRACQVLEVDGGNGGTEVPDSCEQFSRCWESSPSSPEKQLMLWTTEPSSPAPNTVSLAVRVSRPKGRNGIFRWSPSPISRASCIFALNTELLS